MREHHSRGPGAVATNCERCARHGERKRHMIPQYVSQTLTSKGAREEETQTVADCKPNGQPQAAPDDIWYLAPLLQSHSAVSRFINNAESHGHRYA